MKNKAHFSEDHASKSSRLDLAHTLLSALPSSVLAHHKYTEPSSRVARLPRLTHDKADKPSPLRFDRLGQVILTPSSE